MKQLVYISIVTLFLFSLGGCAEDFLDTRPAVDLTADEAFASIESFPMMIDGLCKIFVSPGTVGNPYPQELCGAESGIKNMYGNNPGNYMTAVGANNYGIRNDVASGNHHDNSGSPYTSFAWWHYYRFINNANALLENIGYVQGQESEKNRMKAQALVFRAYAYSMLVQIYGYRWTDSNNGATSGVVLRLEQGYNEMPLSSLATCYQQIYKDLDDAIGFFQASEWTRPAGDYWTPNINVAYAVYARAAINKLDYPTAITMAQKARAGYPLMSVADYQSGFNAPNPEWIWGSYQGTDQHHQWSTFLAYMGYNGYSHTATASGLRRIVKDKLERIPASDIRKAMFLDPTPYNPITFDPVNGRVIVDRQHPDGAVILAAVRAKYPLASALPDANFCSYMHFKFSCVQGPGIGCINHFRSSEMYLIEAEAQFQNGNEARAKELLIELTKNTDRDPEYTCTKSGAELWDEIKFMSQIELWGEGFDWFMTKRWGDRIIHISFANGGNFLASCAGEFGPEEKNKQTWMIPLIETDFNPLAKGMAK